MHIEVRSPSSEETVLRFSRTYVTGDQPGRGLLVVVNHNISEQLKTARNHNPVSDVVLYLLDGNDKIIAGTDTIDLIEPLADRLGQNLSATAVPGKPHLSQQRGLQTQRYLFLDERFYSYSEPKPLFAGDSLSIEYTNNHGPVIGNRRFEKFYLVSVIPETYFNEQKSSYLRFLLILSVTLLVPSLVVCIFLARTRIRVRIEASLRYREHQNHLAELEDKVKQRTRELDDSNMLLSAEIAERLSTSRELQRSNELLTGMLESIEGIIYVADMETYEILFANEYVRRLFGFDPVGRKCWQFLHANQVGPCEFCSNPELLGNKGEPLKPHRWEYQNPFNKRWYAAKDQAILWSNGKYVRLEIAVDIQSINVCSIFWKRPASRPN